MNDSLAFQTLDFLHLPNRLCGFEYVTKFKHILNKNRYGYYNYIMPHSSRHSFYGHCYRTTGEYSGDIDVREV